MTLALILPCNFQKTQTKDRHLQFIIVCIIQNIFIFTRCEIHLCKENLKGMKIFPLAVNESEI